MKVISITGTGLIYSSVILLITVNNTGLLQPCTTACKPAQIPSLKNVLPKYRTGKLHWLKLQKPLIILKEKTAFSILLPCNPPKGMIL